MHRPWTMSLLVTMIFLAGTTSALTPLIHMINHCQKTLQVNESLILDLTEDLKADRVLVGHLSCAVTLQVPTGARLYLHVLQLAISDKAEMPDRLHIYEVSSTGKETKRLTPSMGLYGVLERPFLIYNTAGIVIPDFRSAGPRMRLNYQGKPTIVYRGFRVLITVFYSPSDNGLCRSGTLYCPYAGTCIPVAVRCDTLPNCGLDDSTDEKFCKREDVVTNLLEEYSLRTAVVAGVTGILVFLGVAALVLVFLLRYNRILLARPSDQSVHYSSRGGGSCRYKNETDLTTLYAPPSYDDVMPPSRKGNNSHFYRHRHSGPPPAYSAAVAALIHQEGSESSEEEAGRKPRGFRSRGKHSLAHAHTGDGLPSLEETPLQCTCLMDSQEDVRMHGTWPSDTDEEEEVKARRRRKGGKCKGKSKRLSRDEASPSSDTAHSPEDHQKTAAFSDNHETTRFEESAAGKCTPPSSLGESHSDSSPSHEECLSAASTEGATSPGSGVEAVSETESQIVGSQRNSRTESNSLDGSASSSPGKQSSVASDCSGTSRDASPVSDCQPAHLHESSVSKAPTATSASITSAEDSFPSSIADTKDAFQSSLMDKNSTDKLSGSDRFLVDMGGSITI